MYNGATYLFFFTYKKSSLRNFHKVIQATFLFSFFFTKILLTRMAKQLLEITVQKAAQEYLEGYYKWRARRNKLWSKIEVRTKKEYGGKRADGLLAYRKRLLGSWYVVSMEAKSYKTLDAITPRRDNWTWFKNSAYYGSLITFGSGAFFFYQQMETTQSALIYILGLWVGVILITAILTRNAFFNKTMPVYSQILQYPANEQWVSISEDSYEMIPKKLRKSFVKVLKARGIGLVIVNRKKFVSRIHKPQKRRKLLGNFLKYYSLEKEIKGYLK